jgi:hypothetical protein
MEEGGGQIYGSQIYKEGKSMNNVRSWKEMGY